MFCGFGNLGFWFRFLFVLDWNLLILWFFWFVSLMCSVGLVFQAVNECLGWYMPEIWGIGDFRNLPCLGCAFCGFVIWCFDFNFRLFWLKFVSFDFPVLLMCFTLVLVFAFGVWGWYMLGIWVELPLLGFCLFRLTLPVFGFSGFLLACLVGLVLTVSWFGLVVWWFCVSGWVTVVGLV